MRALLAVAVAVLLGGCAFGRTYSYTDAPINMPGPAASAVALAIGVQDRRPYVLSGGKSERFVGLMRGGFGNPFDVNTSSGGPLAGEMRDALARSLKAKGFAVTTVNLNPSDATSGARKKLMDTSAKKLVMITFTEWKSDTMMNTAIHYDVTLVVMNERGDQLATNSLKGMENIGSLGLSPDGGVATAFARKFETLFDDDKVAAALRS